MADLRCFFLHGADLLRAQTDGRPLRAHGARRAFRLHSRVVERARPTAGRGGLIDRIAGEHFDPGHACFAAATGFDDRLQNLEAMKIVRFQPAAMDGQSLRKFGLGGQLKRGAALRQIGKLGACVEPMTWSRSSITNAAGAHSSSKT